MKILTSGFALTSYLPVAFQCGCPIQQVAAFENRASAESLFQLERGPHQVDFSLLFAQVGEKAHLRWHLGGSGEPDRAYAQVLGAELLIHDLLKQFHR